MNAREREAVERLEKGHIRSSDIELICAAVRRHERLANEWLTEDDKDAIRWYMDDEDGFRDTAFDAETRAAVAKLQAQLAAALQLRDLLLSDPPASREDVVLAVREETAKECCDVIESTAVLHGWASDNLRPVMMTSRDAAELVAAIRRRFGLAAPQPAETPLPETWIGTECPACHGSCVGSDGGPCNTCNGLGRIPPQPAGTVCQRCGGSRRIRIRCGGPADSSDRDYIPCPDCAGQ